MFHEFASVLVNPWEKQLSSLFLKITENNSRCLYLALLQERGGGSPGDGGKLGNIVTSPESGGGLAAH